MPFNARIKSKRDTASNWETNNPVLLNGELIIVDTNAGDVRFKIGDGVKTYTQLPFQDESLYNVLSTKADSADLESIQASIVQSDLSQTDNTAIDYVKGIIRQESLPEGYPYITKKITEWDGNTTDKVAVSNTFYKVSDEIPSNDELKESGIMYVTQNANQTTSSFNIGEHWGTFNSQGYISSDYAVLEYCAVIRSANTEIKGTTFPEPGVYFIKLNDTSWTTKLDYSKVSKLDDKYFDSAYVIDVEVGQSDAGKTTYTLTNGNFNDAYIAYLNKKIIIMQMSGGSGNTLVCTGSGHPNRLEFVQLTEELNYFTIKTLQLKSDNTIDVYQGSNLAFYDHTQSASKISAGTFAGQVVAKASEQTPGTMLLRNSKLVSAEETPTVNGEICWVYS